MKEDKHLPLEGIKCVDFTLAAVGPSITSYLGDFGATVVKVENKAHVDLTRVSAPYKDGEAGLDRSGWFIYLNSSKISITLELDNPSGLEIARKLAKWADILVEGWRPGTIDRWGLNYEELRKINPNIIMLSTSLQGQTGPYSHVAGFGWSLKAFSGFTCLTGWPDRGPVDIGSSYTDFVSPWMAVTALMAALDYRRRTGKGQYLDISQIEASLPFLGPVPLNYTVNKKVETRMGNRSPYFAPHGVYRCKGDDRWCAIAISGDDEWQNLCQAMNRVELANDPRFSTKLHRVKNADELDKLLEAWTINLSPEAIVETLQALGVPAGIVENGQDVHDKDPQIKHRHFYELLEHPVMGTIKHAGWPAKLSKTPYELRVAPCIGQHNYQVCTELLGMSDDEFVDASNSGAFEQI